MIVFAILVYVVLDGFDLGVGILFGVAENEARRDAMLAAISSSGTATRRGSS